jgi:hypothetical protein
MAYRIPGREQDSEGVPMARRWYHISGEEWCIAGAGFAVWLVLALVFGLMWPEEISTICCGLAGGIIGPMALNRFPKSIFLVSFPMAVTCAVLVSVVSAIALFVMMIVTILVMVGIQRAYDRIKYAMFVRRQKRLRENQTF